MNNQKIAKIFEELAVYLKMKDVAFKPQAYERAALSLKDLPEEISEIYRKKGKRGLKAISGIGEGIAKKIIEYLRTGKIKEYEKFRRSIPVNLLDLLKIEGLGPKMIYELYRHLKITNLEKLEKAAQQGKIRNLPRFGLKTEQNILQGIDFLKHSQKRFLLGNILPFVERIIEELKKIPEVEKIDIAGSIRRMKETVGDVDILATVKKDSLRSTKKVMKYFINLPGVIKIWDYGFKKSSVHFEQNFDVDLRIVKNDEFGSALQYFTGSKEHNIMIRKIALEKNLKLNEYGVFSLKDRFTDKERPVKKIAGRTEEEVYQSIGLSYIEPELRENEGEIEAALRQFPGEKDDLPEIIGYNDIRGDLHVHSDWDGGVNSIKELVSLAKEKGYQYLGISDHTKFLFLEHGLDEKRLLLQQKEIQKINRRLEEKGEKFRVLHGCEANILEDGSLDIKDEVLRKLDYVIAGIHSGLKNSKEKMTNRIIRAMLNPQVDIISHLTGRLINRRPEYEIDLEKILKIAKKTGTILEINAFPERLDLKDVNIRKAVEKGVKLIIGSDAHHKEQLVFMRFGIAQARRGWATKKDIINTYPLTELLKFFKQ